MIGGENSELQQPTEQAQVPNIIGNIGDEDFEGSQMQPSFGAKSEGQFTPITPRKTEA